MKKLRWIPYFTTMIVILAFGLYYYDSSHISKLEAMNIADSFITRESPSFLLDQAFYIDTNKNRLSEPGLQDYKGNVWFLRYIQDVDTTAAFYIDANSGKLIKGYIITRKGNVIKEFIP